MWARLRPERLGHKELFVPEDMPVEKATKSWTVTVQMWMWNLKASVKAQRADIGYPPIKRLKAAGFKSSKELSSFRGVLHFWQYIFGAPAHRHHKLR
jgi:hypothetical protein